MRTSVKYLLFLIFILFGLLVVATTPVAAEEDDYVLSDDDDDDDDDDDSSKKSDSKKSDSKKSSDDSKKDSSKDDDGKPVKQTTKKAEEAPAQEDVSQDLTNVKPPAKTSQIDQFKDFTLDVLKTTLNQICQDPTQGIVVFGVVLTDCTVDFNAGSVQVKGLATIFEKVRVRVDLEVSTDAETKKRDYAVSLQLPSSFKFSDVIGALKNTAMDKLTIRNPKVTIVTSAKNSWGVPPGVSLYAEVAPGKADSWGNFFNEDSYFSAEISVSTTNDISEITKAGQKDYTLTLTANNFNLLTDKVLCEKALVAVSTANPQFKAEASCKVKLNSGDLSASLTLSTSKAAEGEPAGRSFEVTGTVAGPVTNTFGVNGLTLQKAGVSAAYDGGLKSFSFNGEISYKGRTFKLDGDVIKGEYSFAVENTNLKDLLSFLDQAGLQGVVPSVNLEEVRVTVQTARKPQPGEDTQTTSPSFAVSAKVSGNVYDVDLHAKAVLELTKGKVSLTCSLDNSFNIGPVTLSEPAVSLVAQSSQSSYEFTLSGKTKIFDFDGLTTTVGFAKVDGKTGFLIDAKLGRTFTLGQIIKQLKGSPLDVLSFKDPEVQISSYPVSYIDNVKRTGVVLKASLVFGGAKQLEGVQVLLGGKVNEIPLVLPFGGSLTGFDIRQMKVIAAIPFPVKTGSKWIQFLDPMSLAIGFEPPSFGLNLDLVVRLPKDEQPIQFRVSFTLDVVGATAVTETMNEWVHPFGIKGLVVRKLALDIGINYAQFAATGTPSRIGIAGYFEFPVVGKVEIATLADIARSQFILYAYIDSFGLQSLREILSQMGANVPKQLLPDIEFKKVKIYVAPTGGNIGSITFEPGYNLEGQLWVFNQNFAEIKVVVNVPTGIIAYGRVSAVKLGPLDLSESTVDLAITPTAQHLYVNAAITIKIVFEIVKQKLVIKIDKDQLYFKYENNIYAIEASANPRNPVDLTITGTIKFTILNDIIKGITAGIREIGKGLDSLASQLEKLEAQKKNIEAGIKSIKIPSNCGSVSTLAYNEDESVPVEDYSRLLADLNEHLGLAEFREMLEAEALEAEAQVLDADQIAQQALVEAEEEELEESDENYAVTVAYPQSFWRRIGRAFRSAGRAISRVARRAASSVARVAKRASSSVARFAKKAGSTIKRTAVKAGNTIKKTAIKSGNAIKRTAVKAGNTIKKTAIKSGNVIKRTAIKSGNAIKRGAITAGNKIKEGGEKAIKELKKICDKAMKGLADAKNKFAEVAAEATSVAAKYTREASKYASGFMKNGFFELESISFTGSLKNIQQTGGLSVNVKVKVGGKEKNYGFNIKQMSKIKDIAKDLMNKIIH